MRSLSVVDGSSQSDPDKVRAEWSVLPAVALAAAITMGLICVAVAVMSGMRRRAVRRPDAAAANDIMLMASAAHAAAANSKPPR
jgi:hypothetical protein